MKTYKEVKEIVAWEWDYQLRIGERDPFDGYEIDIEGTARNAWRAMSKRGVLTDIKVMPEEWQRFETLHMVTPEYLDEPWLVLVPA